MRTLVGKSAQADLGKVRVLVNQRRQPCAAETRLRMSCHMLRHT